MVSKLDSKLEGKVDRLVTDVAEIKIALKGYNGTPGLIPAFREHCDRDGQFRADYFKFKRIVLGVFFFLLGSGVLGVGGVKIAEMMARGG